MCVGSLLKFLLLSPTPLFSSLRPYLVRDSRAEGLAADQVVSPEEMQEVILEVCPAGAAGRQQGVAAAFLLLVWHWNPCCVCVA